MQFFRLLAAFDRSHLAPEFVLLPHEEHASFAACAHAKFTGQVGVCLSTSGPGALHLLTGLFDAQMDHQPVLALVCEFFDIIFINLCMCLITSVFNKPPHNRTRTFS